MTHPTPAIPIERYDIFGIDRHGDVCGADSERVSDGRWVEHTDHVAQCKAAVEEERKRCCRVLCDMCKMGDTPVHKPGGWHHGYWPCHASMIRPYTSDPAHD